jgi:hypothetical protein
VPSEVAKQYHVRVEMNGGPFAIDEKYDSVIRLQAAR